MKTVIFNGAPLTWEDCGIKFYTLALLRELTSRQDDFFYKIIVPKAIPFEFPADKSSVSIVPYKNIFPATYNYLNRGVWELAQLPKVARQLQGDLFFTPHQALGSRDYGMPTVVVVHDTLQWHRDIEKRNWGRQFLYNQYRRGVKKANKIITISKVSQQDIAKILELPIDEIVVAYEGIDQVFETKLTSEEVAATLQKLAIKTPYFFYVGGWHERKNVTGVIKAFAKFVEQTGRRDVRLVIVGKPIRSGPGIIDPQKVEALVTQLNLNDLVTFVGKVDRSDLKNVYRGAAAFLYLSYYEGFGLPPLEAMSQDVPTIVSNRSSLPEVVGDGENLVDPDNYEAIAELLNKIMTEADFKQQLIIAGRGRVANFTWAKTADIIISTWRELLR